MFTSWERNTTRSQEAPIPARALALSTHVTCLANSASAPTPVKCKAEGVLVTRRMHVVVTAALFHHNSIAVG